MTRAVSIATMLTQVIALAGTDDLTDWEEGFVESIQRYTSDTTNLSPKQVEIIERIWKKHFS